MIESILHLLATSNEKSENERQLIEMGLQLTSLEPEQTQLLWDRLADFAANQPANGWSRPLLLLFNSVPAANLENWLEDVQPAPIESIYRLIPADHVLRSQLLALLAHTRCGLDRWIELICSDPPTHSPSTAIAFAPVVNNPALALSYAQIEKLLLDGADHRSVAALIYELANREFRDQRIDQHPAAKRLQQICDLSGGLISRLEMIEEGQLPEGATAESVAEVVQETVALVIALMDTMALLGYEPAIAKMNQAAELKHRRIQVEAAAGLTRLKVESGKQKLIELAQHPAVRPRVIAYAKELGLDKDISLEHLGPIADAESQLALWLAMPEQMGLAPTSMKLVDQRELFWPSYEDPINCYLFEFEYGTGPNAFRNIGISGPLTHAFTSNIMHLSRGDQFSAFAGWQTLSEEIFQVSLDRAEQVLAAELDNLKRRLESSEVSRIELRILASFFNEYVLVATGEVDGVSGTQIVSASESDWIEGGDPSTSSDWEVAFDVWKGRRLLTSFNPSFSHTD